MNKNNVRYSKWLIMLYGASAIVLGPWIYFLSQTLPSRQLAGHWDEAWIGFDVFILILVISTAVLAYRRSGRLPLVASSLATTLMIDAWFDVMTARPGVEQMEALLFALFIEVPLALITFSLIHQALSQVDWDKQPTIVVGRQHKKKGKNTHRQHR